MTQRSNRGKRRGPVRDGARPAAPAQGDRYQKFLPEWMRGNGANGAAPQPQPKPRRPRQNRRGGGYTPGKFALDDRLS